MLNMFFEYVLNMFFFFVTMEVPILLALYQLKIYLNIFPASIAFTSNNAVTMRKKWFGRYMVCIQET